MLKWPSESEYFLSFENFFADTPVQEQSLNPFAAHARRGVTKWHIGVRSWELLHAVSPSADICHWFKGIKEEYV